MPAFLSFTVAPGVRLSASGRGLRAHVGPRVARVHVGGGRTGVSTGAGPVTLYQPVGGPGRSSSRRPYDTGPSAAAVARADKAEQARLVGESLHAIADLPRHTFPTPVRPTVTSPQLPPFRVVLAAAEREELQGVPLWRRRARAAARRHARAHAESLALTRLDDARAFEQFARSDVDDYHRRLAANDPGPVLGMLATAFEDNEAPVAAVGVSGAEASLVVLVPAADEVVPERVASTTAAGNVSLKKMTKTERAHWERELVAGHVVLSVKEAFATAGGLSSASVVAVRRAPGGRGVEVVLCVQLSRTAVAGTPWGAMSAWDLLLAAADDHRATVKGVTKELRALDVSREPELRRLVDTFEESTAD